MREAEAAAEPCNIMDAVTSSFLPAGRGEEALRMAAAISKDKRHVILNDGIN